MGKCPSPPSIIGNGHVVDRPSHLYTHAFVAIIIETHWEVCVKQVDGLSAHPTGFIFEQGKQQARVDRIFDGKTVNGIITFNPAYRTQIISERAEIAALFFDKSFGVKVYGSGREDKLSVGQKLNVGCGRFVDAIWNNQQCARVDERGFGQVCI